MAIVYYGKSEDGSDAKRFEGFSVCKCRKTWGSNPQEVCPYCGTKVKRSVRLLNKLRKRRIKNEQERSNHAKDEGQL